jgi:mannitol-1-phosphate 5-dehydrogenase
MEKSSIIIWGSGAIGRGFVADLFTAAGYEVVLVDQDEGLVEQLRKAGQYSVVRARSESEQEEAIVKDYRVYHTSEINALQAEINQCRLMAIAVYPQFLMP